MYFDNLMHMVTSMHLEIDTDTMDQYVASPTTLKTMMCMLSNELEKGAISVYPNATKARVFFQRDVTIECIDTIMNDQSLHQFATIDHQRMSKRWSYHNSPSVSDSLHGFLKPILSHMGTCVDCM